MGPILSDFVALVKRRLIEFKASIYRCRIHCDSPLSVTQVKDLALGACALLAC